MDQSTSIFSSSRNIHIQPKDPSVLGEFSILKKPKKKINIAKQRWKLAGQAIMALNRIKRPPIEKLNKIVILKFYIFL